MECDVVRFDLSFGERGLTVFEDGNSLLNVAVQAKAFCEFMQEHVNEKGYVNL
jgi:hypothetical protein